MREREKDCKSKHEIKVEKYLIKKRIWKKPIQEYTRRRSTKTERISKNRKKIVTQENNIIFCYYT